MTEENFAQKRIDVCEKCEHNVLGICKKCGCILHLKTKLKSSKCPIGKWDAVRS